MKKSVYFIITVTICFIVQAIALKQFGGRTVKSESNYFSSVGRIQAGAHIHPKFMLLGSSITGRLPDQSSGFKDFANMGCDGGSAIVTLRAIANKELPAPLAIIVEANTLTKELESGKSKIEDTIRSFWFKSGVKYESLSSYARPAAFFYSKLLSKKIGNAKMDKNINYPIISVPPPNSIEPFSEKEQNLYNEYKSLFRALQLMGVEVNLCWLPPYQPQLIDHNNFLSKLIKETDVHWFAFNASTKDGLVKLTDDVHMDAQSAWNTMHSLNSYFNNQQHV